MHQTNANYNPVQIMDMINNGEMELENAIQRGNVWDVKRRSYLVDSMIRNKLVPPIYTAEKNDTAIPTYDVIDGKQRCTAIHDFRSNTLKLKGLGYITLANGSEFDLEGKTYDELPVELQRAFDRFQITNIIMIDATKEDIADNMSRLNHGKPLTNTELARVRAKDLENLVEIADHRLFTENFSEKNIKSYYNEDMVIKTRVLMEEDEPCLDNKAIAPYYAKDFDVNCKALLCDIFDMTASIIDNLKEMARDKKIQKNTVKKVVGKNNMLAVIDLVSRHKDEPEANLQTFSQFVAGFFNVKDTPSVSVQYNINSTSGTGHAPAVRARREAVEEAWKEFKNS